MLRSRNDGMTSFMAVTPVRVDAGRQRV